MAQSPNLSHGRPYLAIPGPSVIPDVVLQAMHRPSPNIYEGELIEMMPGLLADLRHVARTEHHVAIYISNGHGVWEAALSNVLAPGDRVLVPATGSFGVDWGDMAAGLGAEVELLDFGKRTPMDMPRIAEALAADKAHQIKAVLAVHVDTSTSLRNDIKAVRAALDEVGHPALLMVDCIASLGCDRFEMDEWGVDVMVAACQKGLMVPAGIGFVFFNDRAREVRQSIPRVSRYWDWETRRAPDYFYRYFGGTAPTQHLYGLRASLDLIKTEGLDNVWARHQILARAVWAACDIWQQGGVVSMNVADPAHRGHAVTGLRIDAPFATRLRRWTEDQLGLTLGVGLGMVPPDDPAWHGFCRLGHMGHVNGHMIMGMLGGIDAGLGKLGIARGKGALEAASEVIASA